MGWIKIAWIASFIVVFSGCFAKIPQVQYYEIEALNGVKLESKKELFWEISVAPKIASKKIAYKTNANSIAYFSKNAWIEPFSVMVDSLALKIAGNYGILNAQNGGVWGSQDAKTQVGRVKINVLDCYFDAQRESVFVRFFVEIIGGSEFGGSVFEGSVVRGSELEKSAVIEKVEQVESGEFIQIVKAFERALNAGFVEIFTKF
ncbi:hypothetical protein [Helicobacter sp.]|uniref:hypothetical protein n=1 Tax=Helicobacter sp. TaxID=218 RepID=UPI002A756FBA|nr:hypothetical protein [Helicobacter sp.]MDY2585561.1 hypothetical protein [Helicobacter sp.]